VVKPVGLCPHRGYVMKHLDRPLSRLYPDPRGLDSFPMTDDGGVLGNLPNSRPGRRSEKRSASPRPAAQQPPAPGEPGDGEAQTDPVGEAIRTATGIAAAGARVANGVARELVRRLPRP
jgi:hypothetical protein